MGVNVNLFGFPYTGVAVPMGPAVVTTLPWAAGIATPSLAASPRVTGADGLAPVESDPTLG